jgi:hypothetical protein
MNPLTFALLATVGATAAGCSAGGGGAIPDAGAHDAIFEVSVNVPDGCPPATENNFGVGRPCTMGGHECASGGNNLQCSCDPIFGAQIQGIPCFCSRLNLTTSVPDGGTPCDMLSNVQSFCGTGASCCSYLTVGYYCLPNVCLDQGTCPPVSGP